MRNPLVVDLDGTLIRGDLLWEALAGLARERPWLFLLLPIWLLGGRAHLKDRIARLHTPNAALLVYRPEALELCRTANESGRRLILASASPRVWVDAVAAHVGVFDTVLASDAHRNLKGSEKLRAIREEIGTGPFTYVGDSKADAPIWEDAEEAVGLGAGSRIARILSRHPNSTIIEEVSRPWALPAVQAMRPHQWVKNILVFVPLLLAHQLDDASRLEETLLCFILFCLVASAGYLVNDILDLPSDRGHPSKCRRPIASGQLQISHAIGLVSALLLTTLWICLVWLGPEVGLMLGVYVGLTFAYSFYLKQTLLLDVLVLAGLYTHRVLTGGLAADVSVSPWLLAFSAFFFLSLAFVKRYLELAHARNQGSRSIPRRAYEVGDLGMVEAMGLACGMISVLVLCLFISSADVRLLYRTPGLLWLMCPVMFYWISRIWFLARRGELDEDPVLFATRDPRSYVAGILALIIIAAAATW